jgi:long-chain acyl-CoA synthetase
MKPTAIDALTHQALVRPMSAAFVFDREAWTYKRLAVEAERFARGMAAHGVKAGDRVAIHMMNRPEFIIAYYACFRIGAIAAPLRIAFKLAELAPLLNRLRPALYIGDPDLYDNVAAVDAAILPHDRRFLVGAVAGSEVQPWERLLNGLDNEDVLPSPVSNEPTVLINTSGTTGEPKFVVHTSVTLAESADFLVQAMGLSSDDIAAEPLSLAHMSGLVTFLAYIQAGTAFVLQESFDADRVLDAMERHRCTVLIGFPAQYAALLKRQCEQPRDLPALRLCLTGGDVCPIDLQQQVTSIFGAPLHNIWGATESIGSLTYGLRPGPLSRIVNPALVRLVDDDDNDVRDGEVGELLVRGPNLFAGYWNDPQTTAESMKGGWYHTGDLMRRGTGDDLIFVARKKDIIIRGGTNISPVEVEQTIVASHPAVKEAAVVGIPDPALGQRVIGFVKLTNGASERVVSELVDRLADRLAAYKVPEQLVVLDAVPRNALGKVDRKTLQAMAIFDDLCRRLPAPSMLAEAR